MEEGGFDFWGAGQRGHVVVEAWFGGVAEAGGRPETANRAGRWWCSEVGGNSEGRLFGEWGGARLRVVES